MSVDLHTESLVHLAQQPGEVLPVPVIGVDHPTLDAPVEHLSFPRMRLELRLTGDLGPTKNGGMSFRADSCIASFRFATVEFDSVPMDEQAAFWAGVDLPVAAIIDSGGKSLHGWVRVDRPDREAWEWDVEIGLFARRLVPLGVDAACRNEARLSRMPGFHRAETKRWQRLLYLAPNGRRVRA
ncbi:hypothetical protein ACFLSJ_00770 [Verrucomicrobiota bacterium]